MLREVVLKKLLMLHLYVLYITIYYYAFVGSHFVAYVCAQFIIYGRIFEVKQNQCCTETATSSALLWACFEIEMNSFDFNLIFIYR